MVNYGVHWHNNDSLLCFIAGLLLGVISGCRMLVFGKVTGISGFLAGLVKIPAKCSELFDFERLGRLMFVGGIVIGGVVARTFLPGAFQDWSTLPIARLVLAGILVGFGTTMANGCTSGHGVCGLSSFRFRSLVATCTFMLAGFVTAMACNTSHCLPFFVNVLPVERCGAIVGVTMAVCCILSFVAHLLRQNFDNENFDPQHYLFRGFSTIAEFLFGISFGLVMCVSNMTKLSATISFLDLRYWNPALAFIMGGAISVTAASYYWVSTNRKFPMLDIKFYRPAIHSIDAKLITGSVIFGVGWGLAGACPGPALTNLGSGNIPPVIYCSCMVAGMLVQQQLAPFLDTHVFASSSSVSKASTADQPATAFTSLSGGDSIAESSKMNNSIDVEA